MAHTGHIQTIYNYSLPGWSRNRFSILDLGFGLPLGLARYFLPIRRDMFPNIHDTGCLRGEPKLGKNHGSPQTSKCPLCDESYNEGVGGSVLTVYLFPNWRLQQNNLLYVTLSLSISLYIRTLYTQKE